MHVGRKRLLDGLVAVAGFGGHFEIGLGVQNDPQTAQDDRVIVGDQDARLQGCHWVLAVRWGMVS